MTELMQRRRALMAVGKKEEGIPGTIITAPQSCTKADQAYTIWQSIVSNNSKAGFYFTTKKRSEWIEDGVVCVLLRLDGTILSLRRVRAYNITEVSNNAIYDAKMTQGDTFYFVEAVT